MHIYSLGSHESHKLKGSCSTHNCSANTADTTQCIFFVHLAELRKILVWPSFLSYKWVDLWFYKVYRVNLYIVYFTFIMHVQYSAIHLASAIFVLCEEVAVL